MFFKKRILNLIIEPFGKLRVSRAGSFATGSIILILAVNLSATEYRRLDQHEPPKHMQILTPPEEPWVVSPSSSEEESGWILFQRPLVEPVYPGTKPRTNDRLSVLCGFAACGEFETLSFTIYPLHDINGLKVAVSDLTMGDHRINASDIQVRLVTYRHVLYPRYVSKDSCMRLPKFLEPIVVNNAPMAEAQRYFITIKTPRAAAAGLYCGTVTIQCGQQQQLLPVKFRVMPFQLLQDPHKKYSVMYGSGSPLQSLGRGKDPKWIEHALRSDFTSMRDHGLTTLPSFWLNYDSRKAFWYLHPKTEMAIRLATQTGFEPPLLIAGSPFSLLYREATGKTAKEGGVVPEPVPEEVYEKLDTIVGSFAQLAKQEKYPEMIFCPLDEISSQKQFMEVGTRVYQIFKKHGLKTYATKCPNSYNASMIAPYVDYWCSQAFSRSYKDVVSDGIHGYWLYPNLNTYELKDPLIMCKGGRMTFGFGFWKSGYTMIYPYIWRSAPKNHLAYGSAGGNFLDDNGNVIMTTYWECFRQGIDDARYIYTLQDAIVRRKDSQNPELCKLVKNGEDLLQEIWDSIIVQSQYLDNNMWPSDEFAVRRWQMAEMIAKLHTFPPTNHQISPSVIVNTENPAGQMPTPIDTGIGNMDKKSIEKISLATKDFSEWHYGGEGVVGSIKNLSDNILQVDMEMDNSNGTGWPRIGRRFKNGGIDISGYDFFSVYLKISSSRDEVSDDVTPLYLIVYSKNKMQASATIINEAAQDKWLHVLCPMNTVLDKLPIKEQQHIVRLIICTHESKYPDGTKLTLLFKEPEFLKIKQPLLAQVEIPKVIYAGDSAVKYKLKILGMPETDEVKLQTALIDEAGKTQASMLENIMPYPGLMTFNFPLRSILPGKYVFKITIYDRKNGETPIYQQYVNAINSPFEPDAKHGKSETKIPNR